MARLEFPRKIKAAIVARANGKCESCKANLKPSEGEVDHILSCALGGEPTLANGRLLCRVCHKGKSASEIKDLRHGDRMRDKSSGVVRPRQSIPSRPKADKPSKAVLPPKRLFEPRTEV